MFSNTIPAPGSFSLSSLGQGGPSARWRTEAMRSHASGRLIHITKGQGRITVAGLTGGYGPNNLIYIPPHTMYGIEVGPTVFGNVLSFSHCEGWPDHPIHLRMLNVDAQKEALTHLENIERESKAGGDARAAACHFGLLTIFVERQLKARQPEHIDQRQQTAAARLVARYTAMIAREFSADRTVTDFAKALGVTPTHLTRSCRKTCGRSALALLNDRIHFEACAMLRDTEMPINAIATKLGFRSPAYFTRCFQEKSGKPPSKFRKSEASQKALENRRF